MRYLKKVSWISSIARERLYYCAYFFIMTYVDALLAQTDAITDDQLFSVSHETVALRSGPSKYSDVDETSVFSTRLFPAFKPIAEYTGDIVLPASTRKRKQDATSLVPVYKK